MKVPLLHKTLLNAPIIKKGEYSYLVHPLTDGIPELNPELLREVTEELSKQIRPFLPFDKIVTIEAMGIPITTMLSEKLGIPFTIVRKRAYGLPGEISVHQTTGYTKSELFINGIMPGESIVIVDDVLSTGGTIKPLLSALLKKKVNIKGVFVVIDKGQVGTSLQEKCGVPIKSLLRITIENNTICIQS